MKQTALEFRLSFFMLCIYIILLIGMFSCGKTGIEKKKIAYVNSYHRAFPPSSQITEGVYERLPADSFEIVTHFMDTKRNPEEAYIKKRSIEILDSIKREAPDLLIVSDDNAVKYLVEPNYQHDPLPIVFCGVNWTAEEYDLASCNITGIIEILPVAEALQILKSYYPSMQRLLVLNENTTTARKTKPLLDTLLAGLGLSVTQHLVDDFEDWRSAFVAGNQSFDVIYLHTRGAIENWDHEAALKIIDEHMKIPLFTCEDFMMPYAVLGLTQVSREQGIKAAETAKRILKGTKPADIPLSRNTMFRVWINSGLAKTINFVPEEDLLQKATMVN